MAPHAALYSGYMAHFGDVVTEFASRGLIHNSTDRAELSERTTSAQIAAYVEIGRAHV